MGKKAVALIALVFVCISWTSAQNIKIASVAPEATPWGQGLNQLAADWSRITNGRVRVTIFHGSVLGDESDSIRKMRLGQVQGAALTTLGMAVVVPETLGLAFPGTIESDEEMNFVLDNFEDQLHQYFLDEGYEAMAWSHAGWLNLFSTESVTTVNDLQGLKIATGVMPEELNNAFRNLGMQPVPVSDHEMLSGLNSGLIDTLLYAPLGVAGYQWFGVANHMLDLRISPFMGVVLIDSRVWNRIPAQYHEEMRAAAARMGSGLQQALNELEDDAMDLMQRYGLTVHQVTDQQRNQWRQEFDRQSQLEGGAFLNNDLVDSVKQALQQIRQ